ncbi:hypothetical protein Sj15T_10750 [Sphingobium sp. TA15]|uniref:Uncharacterized protein n=1 Tax=Sphingobium indicum (strain DSM 16413 / CCM 7287 / MTCC 6362 / UT26 / NBRC 101211 / UT26S) TaxID=452662 RepID=D4Z8Z4_SPHIU|nr:hypothetical protein [Sphingobium indicum]BAI99076.1 hypothetical protein SJA_P1-01240 [Sphingobium indicum UT26S]BDD66054.1 hypothetical protein Sj15T_10750 [Sphingobium sp. TA15]
MDPQGATPKTSDCPTEAQPKAPRLSQWLWRPWYAKLWWKTAAIFWVAFILEEAFVPRSLSHALFDQYEGWILGALLLFHPFLIVPVLAFGWLWALSNQPRGEGEGWIAGAYDCSTGFGFLGRNMDPTNPADPRFVGLPCNPASEAWRNQHVRGHS